MLDIKDNLYQIRDNIKRHALNCNRDPDEIQLIAVSKNKPFEAIEQAYLNGQRDFAENYLQESLDKIQKGKLNGKNIVWHYIGHLQSNKCKKIAINFDWVHTVSNFKQAQKLNDARLELGMPINVCVQICLEKKTGRNGLAIPETHEVLHSLNKLEMIKLRGLMCVLPAHYKGELAYTGFMQIKNLFISLKTDLPELDTLSMGMSGDYPEAIRAGATMLRLGTAIFGQRESSPTPQHINPKAEK
jgi:hypothetical protein